MKENGQIKWLDNKWYEMAYKIEWSSAAKKGSTILQLQKKSHKKF